LDTEQQSYKRLFIQSWSELEIQYRKGNIDPQHENDVVCYLYHALAKRFIKKGFPLHFIKTEDTKTLKNGSLRPDLNLNNHLFIEVKIYPLRNYQKGWASRQDRIEYTVNKLKQYVAHQKQNSRAHVREPVLAIWFKKRIPEDNRNEDRHFVSSELIEKLEEERNRYSGKATILYGPSKF
jgi:hypothetical protein